jgi:membrane protein DedA with SNARE-associated domain
MPSLPSLRDWVELLGQFYDQYGYLIVFLGALGENTALLGLVLPGGTLALLGAFYARQGTLNLFWVIFFAWIGTVLGYHVDYLIGRFLLARVAGHWSTSRLGLRLRLAARLRLARRLLAKHGGKAILISHTTGHIRSFVALSAGATHMHYPRFLGFELIAALVWNIIYGILGYVAGAEFETIQKIVERAGWVIVGLLVALFLAWRFFGPQLRSRFLKRRRRPTSRQREATMQR